MATYTENYGLHQWEANDNFLREDFNTDLAKIDTGLAEVEQAVKFVKLGGPVVTTAANQTVTFSLSGINMREYTALLFVAEAAASSGYVSLLVNGSSLLTLCSNNWSQSVGMAWIMPGESKVMGFAQGTYSSSESTNGSGSSGALTLAWNAVTSVGASGTSYAGMTCTLYGLKG